MAVSPIVPSRPQAGSRNPSGCHHGVGSRMILSNSCSQLGCWHRNSSTLTGRRTFSVGQPSSWISSKSSRTCSRVAVPPHIGQWVSCKSIDASVKIKVESRLADAGESGKSEIRISKSETNPKYEGRKVSPASYSFSVFVFRICFAIRISSFGFIYAPCVSVRLRESTSHPPPRAAADPAPSATRAAPVRSRHWRRRCASAAGPSGGRTTPTRVQAARPWRL